MRSLNSNSKYVVYLIAFKVCASRFSNTGSTKKAFREGLSEQFKKHRKFRNEFFKNKSKKGLNQQKFHTQFCQKTYSRIDDWNTTLIYQVEGKLHYLCQKESFWQHDL